MAKHLNTISTENNIYKFACLFISRSRRDLGFTRDAFLANKVNRIYLYTYLLTTYHDLSVFEFNICSQCIIYFQKNTYCR